MTTSIGLSSNIDSVIDSIDDVKDDIPHEMQKRVGRAMAIVERRAKMYVRDESHYTGQLQMAITSDVESTDSGLEFITYTDSDIAPYAAIVEFGSGRRTETPWQYSEPTTPTVDGTARPRDFPFESPDIPYNEDDPYNLTGYPSFAGFVGHIEEWMEGKGVEPESGDLFTSAVAIARTIVERGNYAHPFMRPAWFDAKLQVEKAARNAIRNATR